MARNKKKIKLKINVSRYVFPFFRICCFPIVVAATATVAVTAAAVAADAAVSP